MPFCASTDTLKQENEITVRTNQRVATAHLNGDYIMERGPQMRVGALNLCA